MDTILNTLTSLSTIIIAYCSYNQIKFIRNQNRPVLKLLDLSSNTSSPKIYRIKNFGVGTAYDIKILYNKILKEIVFLKTNDEIELEIDSGLDWNLQVMNKFSEKFQLIYKDIFGNKFGSDKNLEPIKFKDEIDNKYVVEKRVFK